MGLLEELLTTVVSLGGGTGGTNLFLGTMPMSPAVSTAIFLTGGPFIAKQPLRYPTFQIVHRNTHVNSGITFVTSLHAGLYNVWNRLPTIKGRIESTSEPGAFAFTGDKLALYSLNFRLTSPRPY